MRVSRLAARFLVPLVLILAWALPTPFQALATPPANIGESAALKASAYPDAFASDKEKGDDRGKGNQGKNKDDKKEKNEKPDKDNKKGKDKGIFQVESYQVKAECVYDGGANQTTCTFTGVAPDSGKKINHVDLPESAICAPVVGGDHVYNPPQARDGEATYGARGAGAEFTLVLEGEVITDGTTTYWLKVASDVFPASGPELSCLSATPTAQVTNEQPTATAEPATGSLVITRYTCTDVPEDRADYDWFGACHLMDGPVSLTLSSVATSSDYSGSGSATGTGETTYAGLDSGEYSLQPGDESWCHGESDNVTSEGTLILTANTSTNVWLFYCS